VRDYVQNILKIIQKTNFDMGFQKIKNEKLIKESQIFHLPGKDFTPWVYALYRVNKRVLTRKIGQFRVTLRDITP
jgi:hypothetical protein